MEELVFEVLAALIVLIKILIILLAGVYIGILYSNSIQGADQGGPFTNVSQIRVSLRQIPTRIGNLTCRQHQITTDIGQSSSGMGQLPHEKDKKTYGIGMEKILSDQMSQTSQEESPDERMNKTGEEISSRADEKTHYDNQLKTEEAQNIQTSSEKKVQILIPAKPSSEICGSPTCPSQVSVRQDEFTIPDEKKEQILIPSKPSGSPTGRSEVSVSQDKSMIPDGNKEQISVSSEPSPEIRVVPIESHDESTKEWDIKMSKMAKRTRNYLVEFIFDSNVANPEKNVIDLSIGDPCLFGNLVCPEILISSMVDVINSGEYNSYSPPYGHHETREAVAKYLTDVFGANFKPDDVMLFSGCSGAIENSFAVVAEKGDNILIPRPDFSMYRTLMDCYGIESKFYNLLSSQNWIADIAHLESQIDSKTKAILVNNPSNPCSSVYSAEHLKDILNVASKHKLPIITDEIYERIVFPGKKFVSLVSLGSEVPIFLVGGISKIFFVPGYRMGWVALHDPMGHLDPGIKNGLKALSSRIMGTNTLVQGAVTKFINNMPPDFLDNSCNILYKNAMLAYNMLDKIPGLIPIMPEGAVYIMVEIENEHFPNFKNTLEFVKRLMEEESVSCTPGEVRLIHKLKKFDLRIF